ncbi:hypothetical protein ACQCSX_04540 [Pseudarthrobacter sp. P1]|uniref:hypothetical protein n=1 Tax=Pseudarthrobacter sp. P1 TaxID=3418418 RepID=UPI003CF60713
MITISSTLDAGSPKRPSALHDGGDPSDPYGALDGGSVYQPHAWTGQWWDSLPHAYKEADQSVNPELGGYPMLRFMDGPGRIAGEIADITNGMYAGAYTDPETAPDSMLRWLAMMLGVPPRQRQVPLPQLRTQLQVLTSAGRPAAGTRAMLQEITKTFLTDGGQCLVEPSSTRPHVLILYVRAYEVPDGDLAALASRVQDSGYVPAGHVVEAKPVITTWDAWEDTAGVTWDLKEANIPTWNRSDSAGVILE